MPWIIIQANRAAKPAQSNWEELGEQLVSVHYSAAKPQKMN
jgi:hypothetical protein